MSTFVDILITMIVDDSVLEQFGHRLKEERERLGLTQEAMAKLGGTARASQYLYEQGTRAPNAEYLLRVMQGGADIVYLFAGEKSELSALNSSVDSDVLTEVIHLVTDNTRKQRKKNIDPTRTLPIVQVITAGLTGKKFEDIDWNLVDQQIESWLN